MTTHDTSPQAVAELCERLDAIAHNMNDWDHPITAVGDLQNAAQTLRDLAADNARLREALDTLHSASSELLEVADLRGDADLPHPADDPKLWTARMTDAWSEIRCSNERAYAALHPTPQADNTQQEGRDE